MNDERLKAQWLKQDELEITAAVGALLEHLHGRRFLWWLLEVGAVGRQPFTGNELTTAFACGELNVGQRILERIINTSAAGYVAMLQEKQNERTERDRALNGTDAEPGDDGGDDADA